MSPVGQVWRDGGLMLLVTGPGELAGTWAGVVIDASEAPAASFKDGETVCIPARLFFADDPDFQRVS